MITYSRSVFEQRAFEQCMITEKIFGVLLSENRVLCLGMRSSEKYINRELLVGSCVPKTLARFFDESRKKCFSRLFMRG